MRDFTLKKYGEIIDAIQLAGMPVQGILKAFQNPLPAGVVIRHDVDRWPKNALAMAKLEAAKGLQTTYYFRIGKATFKPHIIREVAALGHEIGYHYEDLSLGGGDVKKGLALFEKHLEMLRAVAEIKTIAMHGRPLSPYDNRDLWKHAELADYGLVAEAFLSIDYSDSYYFTDTGRSWSEAAVNLRDTVKTTLHENVTDSDSLMAFISEYSEAKISLVAHPERWNDGFGDWMVYRSFDFLVNTIKSLLKLVRNK